MTCIALEDIISYNRIKYASKGDELTLLSNQFHPVLICQNNNGVKFFVRVEKVKDK